jgi:hypothetical protein
MMVEPPKVVCQFSTKKFANNIFVKMQVYQGKYCSAVLQSKFRSFGNTEQWFCLILSEKSEGLLGLGNWLDRIDKYKKKDF